MTVGLPIQRRAVGEAPIWVGEPRVAPVRGSGSNGSKIPPPMGSLAALLGDSPAMKGLRERAARLLQHPSDRGRLPLVLLQGETGTGKGLLAQALHDASPRATQPFVAENCAAIPVTLLEAKLFGYERGAFTGAREPKAGLFQAANRGTLFLDEVGDLPLELQAKLLKVLEDRAVRRLGATRTEPVDVWIISASNADLEAAVRERRFREDLYFRLAVYPLRMPPLRERGNDVILLAEHFLARHCAEYGLPAKALSPDARAALLAHPWRGNVRELDEHDGARGPLGRRPGRDGCPAGPLPRPRRPRRGAGRAAGAESAAGRHDRRGRAGAAPPSARRMLLERDGRGAASRYLPRHAALPDREAPAPSRGPSPAARADAPRRVRGGPASGAHARRSPRIRRPRWSAGRSVTSRSSAP